MTTSRRSKCSGSFSRPGWLGRGALALGSGFSFSGRRPLGFLLDFRGRHAGLLEEQRGLGRGKLFALGSPEAEVEQADFLVLELR